MTSTQPQSQALAIRTGPRSKSPRAGSSWAPTPVRTANAPSIASGSTPSSSPRRKSRTQNTNDSCARHQRQPPPFWNDPNFNHPQQPVTGVSWHEAAPLLRMAEFADRPRYRLPTEAEWERAARGGLEQKQFPLGRRAAAIASRLRHALADRPRASRDATRPTPSASTTSATTSTNGAATGTIRTITPLSPERNPRGPEQAASRANLPAADPGAITSKSPAAPPAPASRRNFSMPTTDFASRARLSNLCNLRNCVI